MVGKMKILYIGCVESSYIILKKLIDLHVDVIGVITKRQSSFNSDFVDLKPLCDKNGIDCIYVDKTNSEATRLYIEQKKPEIGFVFGWSYLISKDIIEMFPNGMIGFHPAELPFNRGRHPLIWALVLDLKETASSFFRLEATPDTGTLVSQQKVTIGYDDDAASLYKKLIEIACLQVEEIVKSLNKGIIPVCDICNNNTKGNEWRKRDAKDGTIDFRMSSRSIYNLVRGLTKPYIGADLEYCKNNYKVWKVEEIFKEGYDNIEPGKIIEIDEHNRPIIKCGDNCIRILEMDLVNLSVGEYL